MAGLQSVIGESIQETITPGTCTDTYYSGISNTTKQCFPAKVQNKFYINFSSQVPGSTSTFLFNPNMGLTDIVVELVLPDLSGISPVPGFARGWGYRALKSISWRLANSAQYFIQSQQHIMDILDCVEDSGKRDAIFQLGGPAINSAADYNSLTNRTAFMYLKLPFNTPNSAKHLPYPSDLSVSPVQLTIELEDWARLAFVGTGANNIPAATPFVSAKMNFRQVELDDSKDLLARRENLVDKMYVYPLQSFPQRQIEIGLNGSGQEQTLNLTGFRSGMVSHIIMMAVKNGDIAANNFFNGVPISNITLTINGDVRYQSSGQSSQLWDLITKKTSSTVANVVLSGASAPFTETNTNSVFTVIPLGQESSTLGNQYELTSGYSVYNSVLQLQLTVPADTAVVNPGYKLYVFYRYRSSLVFNNGMCDYVF